jgi:hypothetical protein
MSLTRDLDNTLTNVMSNRCDKVCSLAVKDVKTSGAGGWRHFCQGCFQPQQASARTGHNKVLSTSSACDVILSRKTNNFPPFPSQDVTGAENHLRR